MSLKDELKRLFELDGEKILKSQLQEIESMSIVSACVIMGREVKYKDTTYYLITTKYDIIFDFHVID